MRVSFSEFALAGIRREFPDHSRQQSCKASLTFYLRAERPDQHFPCPAFEDREIFIFAFGADWRATYELLDNELFVWTFGRFDRSKP